MNEAVNGKPRTASAADGTTERSAADEAVIAAFSGGGGAEESFRARWEPAVAEAEERRIKQAAEAERLAEVRRAEDLIAERAEKTAAAEKETMKESKPMDLREFTSANEFADIPVPESLDTQEAASGADALIPPAEQIEAFAAPPASPRRADSKKKKKKGRADPALSRKERFVRNNIPRKGDSGKEIARKVIRAVSLAVLLAALIYLAVYAVKFYQRKRQTEEFRARINDLEHLAENLTDEELEVLWKELRAEYPDVDFPEGMQVKFSHIYAVNDEFVGWLKIANTNIETPLLQRPHDNYYYLYHDIYKKSSRYGNPYINCNCNMGPEGLSRNTIIYGHNTHDGLMFHQLTNYMKPEGVLKAPVITMDTLWGTTKWKIFAVMLTNSTPEGDNGYVFDYLYPEFSSDAAFMAKIREIQRRSMIYTGVDVRPDEKIITLYTCFQNYFKGGRLVILARELREGESESLDPSVVRTNENAHYPSAYYGDYGVDETEAPAAVTPDETQSAVENENETVGTQPADEAGNAGEAGNAEEAGNADGG